MYLKDQRARVDGKGNFTLGPAHRNYKSHTRMNAVSEVPLNAPCELDPEVLDVSLDSTPTEVCIFKVIFWFVVFHRTSQKV